MSLLPGSDLLSTDVNDESRKGPYAHIAQYLIRTR
jgi:hypothetical protein